MNPLFIRFIPAFALALTLFATPASGQVDVSTPEVTCEAAETITVPVLVSDLSGQGAIAYSLRLQYDPEKISITGADWDNTLSAAFTVVANPKPNEILVSAASTTPLSGAGTLINLTVVCNTEGSSPLSFSKFTFNEGDPSATVSNGQVTVEGTSEVQIEIQINPEDVDFGSVELGESATRTVTIANLETSGASLSGNIVLSGNEAFTIVSGGGSFTLAAGQSRDVVLSFDPEAEGDYTAQLQVTHNATSQEGPSTITVTGSAAAPAAPAVSLSESSLDLGNVAIFHDGTASFTIENTGNAELTGSIEIQGADAADFGLEEGAESFTIEAGGSLEITVTFAPETVGEKQAEIQITHDAENIPSPATVSLTGNAVDNTAAENLDEMPTDFRLAQNFPNPFNPATTLAFGLPEAGNVRISVYDLTGREMSVLVDGFMPAGWHTVNFDASALPSGTYLYHMQAESHMLTRKMTLLK
ncbi:MAG TPA: choice-of-anchor D domain-containing protein [Rhodothermales bacterium]